MVHLSVRAEAINVVSSINMCAILFIIYLCE